MIIRKIIRIVANRCQIFGGKNLQISISAGAPPQTPFEELTALCLTPWLHLSDPISKGRGGEEEGRVNEEENEGRKNYFGPPQSLPQIDATGYLEFLAIIYSKFDSVGGHAVALPAHIVLVHTS